MSVSIDKLADYLRDSIPSEIFMVGDISIKVVQLRRSAKRFYRVVAPGFAHVDVCSVPEVVDVVSSLSAALHPLYQPEFVF